MDSLILDYSCSVVNVSNILPCIILTQVPDHQEVYVDRDSEMSLIVELLSYDEDVSDDQAAAHYYNDLAQCNEVIIYNTYIISYHIITHHDISVS